MTSKEKLEDIVKSRDIPNWDKEQIQQFKNDIENDLEVLELLKENIKHNTMLKPYELLVCLSNNDYTGGFVKLKEWLENDK